MNTQAVKLDHGPLVTVVVPCYNYGLFVGEALESVLAQTYQNWECIVVDDGSVDETKAVVNRYEETDSRIKYFYQRNQGLAASRNLGIKLSKGAYLQFLDADDQIESQKLEFQLGILEDNMNIDIVYGSVRFFETGSKKESLSAQNSNSNSRATPLSGSGVEILRSVLQQNPMVVNAPLIRSKAAKAVGDFDGDVKGIEDWDYWIRCAVKKKRFEYRPNNNTNALVRSHPTSMSKDSRLMLSSTLRLREKIENLVTEAELIRLNRKLAIDAAGLLGIEEVLHGSKVKGMYQLLKSGVKQTSLNAKAKSLLCCSLAPFVTKQQFRQFASSSLSRSRSGKW